MPLPAALAARLAKRGILPKPRRCKYYYRIVIYIKSTIIWELSVKYHNLYFIPAEVLEEVFAENYDDQEDDTKYKSSFNKNDIKWKIIDNARGTQTSFSDYNVRYFYGIICRYQN